MMRATVTELESHIVPAAQVNSWRIVVPAVAITMLAMLAIYRETAAGMWAIWARSDTYAHCFVVPLVSIWLVWRDRAQLKLLSPRPSWAMLLPLAVSGFMWLIGVLSTVNALSHFSLVAMLVLCIPVVLGIRVAR